jgi:hypothetical protein
MALPLSSLESTISVELVPDGEGPNNVVESVKKLVANW